MGLLHLCVDGSSLSWYGWVFFILVRRGSSSSWKGVGLLHFGKALGLLHLGEALDFFILERREFSSSWRGVGLLHPDVKGYFSSW